MRSPFRILAELRSRRDRPATNPRRSRLPIRPERIRIDPFLGYATDERALVQGRIVENEGLIPSEAADTPWKNIKNLYRRFSANRLPGIRIHGEWGGTHVQTVTDDDGYFRLSFAPPRTAQPGWNALSLWLPDASNPDGQYVTATGSVLTPPEDAEFGVISDLDDTVLMTNVASRIRMLATVALCNARTRTPFSGVAAFYRGLQEGLHGDAANPLFYVSKCPWNLFDLLTEFFRIQDIPLGPMLLRQYRIRSAFSPDETDLHKLASIRSLLEFYPRLPFVLIGDSGEEDPEVYAEIVRSYPNRIPVIYIRSVSRNASRSDAIEQLAMEMKEHDCELIQVSDTELAAAHARERGLIPPAAMNDIRKAKRADAQAATQAMYAS